MPNKIKIACQGADVLDISEMIPIQGNLKDLEKKEYEQLKKEILEDGFSVPFFIWKTETANSILDGTQRHRVLTQMREEGDDVPKLPVNWIEASNLKQAKRKLLAFTSQYGKMTNQGLYEFNAEDFTMDEMKESFRFSEVDFKKYEAEYFKDQSMEGENDVPEIRKTSITLGNLFELGNHRLLCGDATDSEQVSRLMNGEKADMVYTDPPYGMNLDTDFSKIKGSSKATISGGGRKYRPIIGDGENYDPTPILNIECDEMFMWGADYYHHKLPNEGSWIVWDKRGSEEADKIIGASFEICWSKKTHKKEICRVKWIGAFGDPEARDRVHPTQKPTKLHEWFFERWAKDKTNIVDLYLGSGSTLIACEKTNRRCFGMEIDPQYCQVIIDRWEKFTGQKAILITESKSEGKQPNGKTIQARSIRKSKGQTSDATRVKRAKNQKSRAS